MLDIQTVGLAPDFVPYLDGWDLQRRIHADVVAGTRPDTLLLLEHRRCTRPASAPSRRSARRTARPWSTSTAAARSPGTVPVSSSGYPIVRLPEPMDVVAHVRRLERLLIDVLRPLGVDGYQVEGRSGVWVRRPLSEDKVAAIGVRVQQGVTMHGFAINCDNTLAGFRGIIPCGITDAGVTTVSEVVGRDVSPADIVGRVAAAFAAEYAEVAA